MWKKFAILVICILHYSTATQQDMQCNEVVKGAIQNCFYKHETTKKTIEKRENICENVNKIIRCVTSGETLTQDAQDDFHRKCHKIYTDSSSKYSLFVYQIESMAGIWDLFEMQDCPKANKKGELSERGKASYLLRSLNILENKRRDLPSKEENALNHEKLTADSNESGAKNPHDSSSKEIKKEPIKNANENLNSNSPKKNEVKSESSSINEEKSESGPSGPDSAENLLKSLNQVENKHVFSSTVQKQRKDDSSGESNTGEIKKKPIQNSNENLKNNEVKSDSSSINKEKSDSGKNKNSSGQESAENLLMSLNEVENKHEFLSAVQKQGKDESSGKSNTGDKEKYKENLKRFNDLFLANKVPISESNVENEEFSGATEEGEVNENGEESSGATEEGDANEIGEEFSGATEEGDANENGDNMSKAEKNLFLFNLLGERKKELKMTKQYGKYKEW